MKWEPRWEMKQNRLDNWCSDYTIFFFHFGKICCCSSVAQSCPTLWDPMDCSMPDFPVLHHLLEFAQVHVYCISDAIQPSHPLMPSSSAPDLSQHQGLFQWVVCSSQMTKILELQLWHQFFQWIFRVDFPKDWLVWSPWCPRDFQESSQHHSSKASILCCSAFFMFQFSQPFVTTGKTSRKRYIMQNLPSLPLLGVQLSSISLLLGSQRSKLKGENKIFEYVKDSSKNMLVDSILVGWCTKFYFSL